VGRRPCGNLFIIYLNYYYYYFVVLGFELRAFTLNHSTSPIFVMGFFEIRSHEPFAWAGFEPPSS
jgi:hypothetical protein